jgi:hypothetical protein
MRRISALILAATSVLILGGAPALAAPPLHEPLDLPPLEFAAGDICDFPILLETTGGNIRQTTFAATKDGSVRVLQRGFAMSEVTNLASGESLTFGGGSRITIMFRADGSVEAWGSGKLFAFYFAGDVGDLGPGVHSVTGRVTERYGTDGSLTDATFSGRAENLCDVLAAD